MVTSRCWHCINPQNETLAHVFFHSPAAQKTWLYFFNHASLLLEELNLQQAIIRSWTNKFIPRLKPVFQALPVIIVWELWKRRNNYKYGEAVIVSRVIYQVSSTLQTLVKVRTLGIKDVPHKWPDLLMMMEQYTPRLKVNKVIWELPSDG